MNAVLLRTKSDDYQTTGVFSLLDESGFLFNCFSLELPHKRNQTSISRIPSGRYLCKKRHSKKYGWHYILDNVPNRSYILIHFGNYNRDTKGCILLGKDLIDINGDGKLDVTSSRKTMEKLLSIASESFYMDIVDIDF